jgi:hypothetical protein
MIDVRKLYQIDELCFVALEVGRRDLMWNDLCFVFCLGKWLLSSFFFLFFLFLFFAMSTQEGEEDLN